MWAVMTVSFPLHTNWRQLVSLARKSNGKLAGLWPAIDLSWTVFFFQKQTPKKEEEKLAQRNLCGESIDQKLTLSLRREIY